MISIVMAYYNRKEQLIKTLESINQQSYKDIEVIIIDDGSSLGQGVPFAPYSFKTTVIDICLSEKTWCNPCIPFNIGFKAAKGDIIIIQNPECYHNGEILKHAAENVKDNNYITYGCFSLDESSTRDLMNLSTHDKTASFDGDFGWYNHSIYRPANYHFCSAITRKNLEELGGFDERYANGVGYDDDEFLIRIKKKGLKVELVDTPFVYHQWHYSSNIFTNKPSNENLFKNTTLKETTWKVNA